MITEKGWLIMVRITRLKAFLTSLFLFLVVSCDSRKYDISWNSFDTITEHFITITFWDNFSNIERKYNLEPARTKYIVVPKNTRYIGEEMAIGIRTIIFPDPDKLPNGGTLEIFLFNPKVEQSSENEFIMHQQKDVEAYFVKFSQNGERYYAVSKDEIISIKREITFEPDSVEQLLNIILIDDIIFYDKSGNDNYNGSEQYWGGYIVKSKQNNKYLWLNSSLPWF
jgi:hypothetical protein